MPDMRDVFMDLLEDGAETLTELSSDELLKLRAVADEIVRLVLAECSRRASAPLLTWALHRDNVTPIGYGKEKK